MLSYENLKVLVVDDIPTVRVTVRSLLYDIGMRNVVEAGDGFAALALLKREKFDVVITDWNMPNLDGISLVRIIRGDPDLKDMVVLMVTAEAKKDQVLSAIKAGINDFIVKPFTCEDLQKKIGAALNKV